MKIKCGFFTNIAPLYSRPLWYQLSESDKVDYFFYSSRYGFSGIKTIDINESKSENENGKLNWFFLKNLFIKNLVFYQAGIISKCLKTNYDVYILYGEMHCISNWIAGLICKARKKPVLFLGHGIYGNEKHIKKTIRLLYYRIADYHLVYGSRSRNLMVESGFDLNKIYVVYNSLDYNLHRKLYEERDQNELDRLRYKLFSDNSKLPVVIFIGRLTEEKKISYLLEAVLLSKKKGNDFNCLIVGGGSESDNLRNLSGSMGISDNVYFYGPSYDETINAKLIMLSECCVSPGNVGLTAIHSLSLGTPVITHGNMFNQGPEAEAVIQDKTGLFFEENNVKSLSDAIDDMILKRKKLTMEADCIEQVKEFWNPVKQTAIFDKAVLNSIKGKYAE
ncbi:MAG: glycosyltransferase [Bacteroidales bacterium]|nr:glycosyltransferase [Bacteroidales bacterium]